MIVKPLNLNFANSFQMNIEFSLDQYIKFIFDKDIIFVKFNNGLFEDDLFSDIKYALFSTFYPTGAEKEDICGVYYKEKEKYLEFKEMDHADEMNEKMIKECRIIAFSFLKFAGIPIVIQSPHEKLTPSYFIDASSTPFQKYPGLAKLVYPEQIENCYIVFNPSTKFKNSIINGFIEAIDGISPSKNKYRISCFDKIDIDTKYLFHFPIANKDIPKYANLYKKENFLSLIKEISTITLSTDLWAGNGFYASSYVDIGFPEESMVVASATSNSLFLTPGYGEIRFVAKEPFHLNSFSINCFLFRSKNCEDKYENLRTFASAFALSTNIIIPFTVPCYDLINMLSMFAQNSPEVNKEIVKESKNPITYKNTIYQIKKIPKRIIFYTDIPKKGSQSINFATDIVYNQIKSKFTEMEVFKDTEFVLCKSQNELVKYLRENEKADIDNLSKNDKSRENGIVYYTKYEYIDNVLKFFFDDKKH